MMEKKLEPDTSDNLREDLTENMIRLEALTQLLIKKGVITKQDIDDMLAKTWNKHEATDGESLPVLEDEILPVLEDEILPVQIDNFALEQIIRCLPNNVKLIDGYVVCDDPVSANELCGPCVAQNTMLFASAGVKDICGLPELMKKKKNIDKTDTLRGVNQECWMYVVAYKMLDAEENKLISAQDIPIQMVIAAGHVESAIEQDIPVERILSIIDCVVLEALPEEDEPCSRLGEENKEKKDTEEPYADIDWRH